MWNVGGGYFFFSGSEMHHPALCAHGVYGDNICYLIFSRLYSAIYSICKLIYSFFFFFSFEQSGNVCSGVSLNVFFISDYRAFFPIKRIHYISMVEANSAMLAALCLVIDNIMGLWWIRCMDPFLDSCCHKLDVW